VKITVDARSTPNECPKMNEKIAPQPTWKRTVTALAGRIRSSPSETTMSTERA